MLIKGSTNKKSRPKAHSNNVGTSGIPSPNKHHSRKNLTDINLWVEQAADYYHLPQTLVHAVITVESAYNVKAVSRVGAQGLMQLMPPTAKRLHVKNAFDPKQNIFGGSRYLRILLNRFDGDLVLALSGYHAGEGAVEKRGGIPYAATKVYVTRVLTAYDRLRNQN